MDTSPAQQIEQLIQTACRQVYPDIKLDDLITVEHPTVEDYGDYSTNLALRITKAVKKPPMDIAQRLKDAAWSMKPDYLQNVDVVRPGFINFRLKQDTLLAILHGINRKKDQYGQNRSLDSNRYLIEFAHPNTHKEIHIGHIRTLITGEALCRLSQACGVEVFRANYQGDIGPHVAKALFGVQKLLEERQLSLESISSSWSNTKKAHFLGEAYVRGNQEYEANKSEIEAINTALYEARGSIWDLYQMTRKWSLDYDDEFYQRFATHFDRLFFESEMAACGKEIVQKHIGKVFIEDEGAVIFPGDRYGLHKRVFITKAGHPTYEGKEMCNGMKEYEAFPFDKKIHVVGSDQAGYFQVVFKALELIDPTKFAGKQQHVSMGIVYLTDRKMSSRTGEILRVDWLIDQIKAHVQELISGEKIQSQDQETLADQVTIGALKYSMLRVGTGQDVAFDIEKSISLEGDSGPYLQYTYARCQSIIKRSGISNFEFRISNFQANSEELALLRWLYRFPEVVEEAALKYAPNTICSFLFELAKRYNTFYHAHSVLEPKIEEGKIKGMNPRASSGHNFLQQAAGNQPYSKLVLSEVEGLEMEDPVKDKEQKKEQLRQFRLVLTAPVAQVLKNGLYLIGIETPERM